MGAQSAVMMKMAGENWQYGKRRISAMSNEDFNAMTPVKLYQIETDELRAIIPSIESSLASMTPLTSTIVTEMINTLKLGVEASGSYIANIVESISEPYKSAIQLALSFWFPWLKPLLDVIGDLPAPFDDGPPPPDDVPPPDGFPPPGDDTPPPPGTIEPTPEEVEWETWIDQFTLTFSTYKQHRDAYDINNHGVDSPLEKQQVDGIWAQVLDWKNKVNNMITIGKQSQNSIIKDYATNTAIKIPYEAQPPYKEFG